MNDFRMNEKVKWNNGIVLDYIGKRANLYRGSDLVVKSATISNIKIVEGVPCVICYEKGRYQGFITGDVTVKVIKE